mmetsp:Transcript_60089/g.140459  ORF Transcript_60089/g.140459 Transcript_60089/m.140459 type:complete len:89 (-) Transcript_60089:42-308(-)
MELLAMISSWVRFQVMDAALCAAGAKNDSKVSPLLGGRKEVGWGQYTKCRWAKATGAEQAAQSGRKTADVRSADKAFMLRRLNLDLST